MGSCAVFGAVLDGHGVLELLEVSDNRNAAESGKDRVFAGLVATGGPLYNYFDDLATPHATAAFELC